MSGEAETLPKKSRKSNLAHKKYSKRPRLDEEDNEVLEEEEEHQMEVVTSGGQISSGV